MNTTHEFTINGYCVACGCEESKERQSEQCPVKVQAEKKRKQRNRNRRERDQVMRDCGLTKVRVNGKVYWE
jgi:hypothetical protein